MEMTLPLPELKSAISSNKFIFTTITPLAMHGAEREKRAEFRTPSIKGIYRYWWRTLQTEIDPGNLLEKETEFFGGTNTDNKRKSPITLVVGKPFEGRKRINVLPHKQPKFWTTAIDKGNKVTLKIQMAQHRKGELSKYEQYLQYMFHLAGMGQRARRGFGALQWEEHKWQSIEEFIQSLRSVMKELDVEKQFQWNQQEHLIAKRKDSVEVIHPVLKTVYIGRGKENADDVLIQIGKASHKGNRFGSLGSVLGGRWASPVWCTVRKIGDKYYPIISEMHTSREIFKKKNIDEQKYQRSLETFLQELGVNL